MLRWNGRIFVAVSLLVLILYSGAPAQFLEKAKAEGQVLIYTSSQRESVEPLTKAFEKQYPGIKVEVGYGRGSQNREKVRTESRAGKISVDLFSSGWDSLHELNQEGLLEKYSSPQNANFHPWLVDKSGMTNRHHVNIYGIMVSSRLVPAQEEPRAWADLADPKWRGKLAMQDPRPAGGGAFNWIEAMMKGPGLGEPYLRNVAKQKPFFGRSNDIIENLVIRGEYGVMIANNGASSARHRSKGAPLKFIKPKEGIFYVPIGFGLIKNAPHSNAAKLYIEFVMSEAGQKIIGEEIGDAPGRRGVRTRFEENSLEGVKVISLDIEELRTRREETVKKIKEIFF